ncbi:MAG TPA: hypothetical protein VHI13_06945 [Candidatus Kapabacteria bacterium]|nr:hypothetical protein [Candidatus Kapabacteria bacterium]
MKINLLVCICACILTTATAGRTSLAQTIEWDHHHGDSTTDTGAADLLQTTDGGYITVGSSSGRWETGTAGDTTGYIVRFDRNGHFQWDRKVGQGASLVSILPWQQNGFVVAGTVVDSLYIAALDSTGRVTWQRRQPLQGVRVRASVATRDGGYAILGSIQLIGSHTPKGFILCKYDAIGTLEWSASRSPYSLVIPATLLQGNDGTFIIGGTAMPDSSHTNSAVLLYIDSAGGFRRAQTIAIGDFSMVDKILTAADGGYILGGWSSDTTFHESVFVVHIDDSGREQWRTESSASSAQFNVVFGSMTTMSNGDIIVAGSRAQQDPYLLRLNSQGYITWDSTYPTDVGHYILSLVRTPDDDIVLAGSALYPLAPSDVLLFKIGFAISAMDGKEACPLKLDLR